MNARRRLLLTIAILPVTMALAASPSRNREAEIQRALPAAPAVIGARATVAKKGRHGHWIVLNAEP
jgi:hypothetical protein